MVARSRLCSSGCCKAGRRPRPWECQGRGTWAGSPGRRRPISLCSLEWCRQTAARSAGFWCRAPPSWTWLLLVARMVLSDASPLLALACLLALARAGGLTFFLVLHPGEGDSTQVALAEAQQEGSRFSVLEQVAFHLFTHETHDVAARFKTGRLHDRVSLD